MKTFHRQAALAKRYNVKTTRTIARMRKDGRIPPPDFFLGPYPMWSDETLETHEAALSSKSKPSPEIESGLSAGETNSA
jgi:hypothetical protein